MDAEIGPQPPACDDGGTPRLGAVAPTCMGRAADLLYAKGVLPTDDDFLLRNDDVNARIAEAFEAEGADAWYEDGAKERFLGGS